MRTPFSLLWNLEKGPTPPRVVMDGWDGGVRKLLHGGGREEETNLDLVCCHLRLVPVA